MRRVGELMWQAVQEFYRVVSTWYAGLPPAFDPRTWTLQAWLIAAGVLLILLLLLRSPRRARRGPRRGWPELMISHGEITLLDPAPLAAAADGGRRRAALLSAPEGAAFQLRMTVSNLNTYPMQLLELVVRVTGARQPVVADASAVVPPHGAVDVVADLADLPGESGTFELYLYGNRSRPRTVKLSVPLEWEPWNQRYRLRATGQRVERAGALPSASMLREDRNRRRAARVAAGARQAAHSVTSGAERIGVELRRSWARFQTRREARVAAARERARAAEAASLRPVPTSVPFGPAARSSQAASQPAAPAAPRTVQPHNETAKKDEPPRRLDFPDEF